MFLICPPPSIKDTKEEEERGKGNRSLKALDGAYGTESNLHERGGREKTERGQATGGGFSLARGRVKSECKIRMQKSEGSAGLGAPIPSPENKSAFPLSTKKKPTTCNFEVKGEVRGEGVSKNKRG